MNILLIILMVLLFLLFVINIWYFICNSRTLKQRLAIINWVYIHNNNYEELKYYFDQITYHQHSFALFCFKDPKNYTIQNCLAPFMY